MVVTPLRVAAPVPEAKAPATIMRKSLPPAKATVPLSVTAPGPWRKSPRWIGRRPCRSVNCRCCPGADSEICAIAMPGMAFGEHLRLHVVETQVDAELKARLA